MRKKTKLDLVTSRRQQIMLHRNTIIDK